MVPIKGGPVSEEMGIPSVSYTGPKQDAFFPDEVIKKPVHPLICREVERSRETQHHKEPSGLQTGLQPALLTRDLLPPSHACTDPPQAGSGLLLN